LRFTRRQTPALVSVPNPSKDSHRLSFSFGNAQHRRGVLAPDFPASPLTIYQRSSSWQPRKRPRKKQLRKRNNAKGEGKSASGTIRARRGKLSQFRITLTAFVGDKPVTPARNLRLAGVAGFFYYRVIGRDISDTPKNIRALLLTL
jgi:hypothetical protein